MQNTILCNEEDLGSLQHGEFLSSRHDGKEIVVSEQIQQGKVLVYDETGFPEEIDLRD